MIKKIQTDKAPSAIGPYSQATVINGMVYTSGQIAINPSTGNMINGDVTEQTHQVIKNLNEVLLSANSSLDFVVKTTCFLADICDFSAFNEVYGKYFTSKPARSCVAAKDLPKGALVEIEVIAYISG